MENSSKKIAKPSLYSEYFRAYGGFKSVFKSTYLLSSFFISLLIFPFWLDVKWPQSVFVIVPILAGFAIATLTLQANLAITLGSVVNSKDTEEYSPIAKITAASVHFALVCIVCLLFALSFQAHTTWSIAEMLVEHNIIDKLAANELVSGEKLGRLIASYIGCVLLIYAIVLSLPQCITIFGLVFAIQEE